MAFSRHFPVAIYDIEQILRAEEVFNRKFPGQIGRVIREGVFVLPFAPGSFRWFGLITFCNMEPSQVDREIGRQNT